MKGHIMSRPNTYLPTPADAPVVAITDEATGETWRGVLVDGIVHDASGFIAPEDIGVRFTVTAPVATRDDIFRTRAGSLSTYRVTSDMLAGYSPIGVRDDSSLWAISDTLKVLVLVERTGSVPVRGKGDQVRVRISFAEDMGDEAGTLRFDREHIGGVAPRVLFQF
jgi:hypothetical protein